MKKVVLAGGSGFLGQALARSFVGDGIDVVVLSRSRESEGLKGRIIQWDARTMGEWKEELEGADVLINLTGRSVDCRYTEENRSLILNSRIDSTRVLGEAVEKLENPPQAWFNASTATIYNDCRGDSVPHDEKSEVNARGFSEEVGRAWENAFFDSGREGVRQVALRITIVLGQGGGAFPVMHRFCKLGLGGAQGPGSQWMSWIHVEDWIGIVRFLINNKSIEGPVNLAAPYPVTNSEFMREMRKQFAPFGIGLPAPSLAVRMGAVLIGTEPELVLKSRKVVSRILGVNGYEFRYPTIESGIKNLSG